MGTGKCPIFGRREAYFQFYVGFGNVVSIGILGKNGIKADGISLFRSPSPATRYVSPWVFYYLGRDLIHNATSTSEEFTNFCCRQDCVCGQFYAQAECTNHS
jgi:hypothetical protein